MAQPFNAIVAIDTPTGTTFANVRRLGLDGMVFELERAMVSSAEMVFRLEVPGRPALASGRLVLRDMRPVPNLGVVSHKARITELFDEAGPLIEAWLAAAAGEVDLPDRDASTSVWTGVLSGASPDESATVLSRYTARLHSRGSSEAATHQSGDISGENAKGRRVIRNAMRASLGRVARPDPVVAEADPRCTRGRGSVEVRFSTAAALRRCWEAHLCRAGLFVPLLDLDAALIVDLVLPSGLILSSNARVVAPMSNGSGLAVELTDDQRRALEAEVG